MRRTFNADALIKMVDQRCTDALNKRSDQVMFDHHWQHWNGRYEEAKELVTILKQLRDD